MRDKFSWDKSGAGESEQTSLLSKNWYQALAQDKEAQATWHVIEGGEWSWETDGVRVKSNGAEWSGFGWQMCNEATFRNLKNFVVEVTVSGKAEAVGLSFGAYKDFLTRLEPDKGVRHLKVEVDGAANCWNFQVDGQVMQRCWWDVAVHSAEDLINGLLEFKGRRVEQVLFQNLTIRIFEASCQLSVIVTCYRFIQRLRITLRNWCYQEIPFGSYEVLVVNPDSPDGTHEHLAAVNSSYPEVRVREITVDARFATNKGFMINRAAEVSRGDWLWLTDADCLFSPLAAALVLKQVKGREKNLFYGQRRYLDATQTAGLLAGRIDGLNGFEELARTALERAPDIDTWGYTQIIHSSAFKQMPYREQYNHFAHSDNVFVQDCKRRGIEPHKIEGLFCLHLDHPFAWYGTKIFL